MKSLLNNEQKNKLLKIARDTITEYVKNKKILEIKETDPLLNQKLGAFVSLHINKELRGCIGNIVGQKPLCLTIRDMAIASATEDPRFRPLTKEELPLIHIEISVLSALKKIIDPNEITLGKHGVIVKKGIKSGVFLPQVATETCWTKEEFMNNLCIHKAGLSKNAWRNGECEIYIFSADVFEE
ncbi:MAG: AmmeMemoRadiSam system protein A [Candidatus Omnitrophota bacterium]